MQSFFDILSLPTAFALDLKALEQAYFAAQRATHPDRFIGKPEAERIAAIGKSQLVNDAYETLKNPLTRAEHLLALQNIHVLSEDAKASPAILAEMMDLRERIFDAGAEGPELARLVEEIHGEANATQKNLEAAFDAKEYPRAAEETIRLQYLGKAMEEAHMHIYRLKAAHG